MGDNKYTKNEVSNTSFFAQPAIPYKAQQKVKLSVCTLVVLSNKAITCACGTQALANNYKQLFTLYKLGRLEDRVVGLEPVLKLVKLIRDILYPLQNFPVSNLTRYEVHIRSQ